MVLAICISTTTAVCKSPDDYVSARDMLADVQNDHNRTYLRGVWDGFESANVSLEENHQRPLFCQPPKLEIPLDQVISILKRYIERYIIGDDHGPFHSPFVEARLDTPVDGVLLDALQDVFPCPGKNPKAQ
jgi:hypothetical protein